MELKVLGQRYAMDPQEKRKKDIRLIHFLKSVIDNKEVIEFEDIGFCYWNLSDNYALIKDGYALMCNHHRFYEHIKAENDCYLYWLVCDSTQRLALENDGYLDFWWALYAEATEYNYGSEYYFAEFSAHRAALYNHPRLRHSQHNLNYAQSNFERFLMKTNNVPEYQFYLAIYLSLMTRFSEFDEERLMYLCELLLCDLSLPETSGNYLIGEWKSFITPFDKRKQATVGINSIVNAFIDSGDLQIAKKLYNDACVLGLRKNHYIEARLK